MKNNFNKILFIATIVLFAIIFIQSVWHPISFRPLDGATYKTDFPTLTLQNYKDNSFQRQLDKYSQENFGFREWAFRFYNQYLWSFYHKTNAEIVIEGKDGYLFEKDVVRDHYQSLMYNLTDDTAFMTNLFETEVLRLWKVQELLKEHDIHIFVNAIPSKDVIYPEYLPENVYNDKPDGVHAYDYYKPRFDDLGINYIDNITHFQYIKDKIDYPLFTKTGTHWSNIAATYAFDSIIKYMEKLGNKNLLNINISEKYLDKNRHPDNDLEQLLNLTFPIKPNKNYYADVTTIPDSTAVTPKLITIGDSFFWTITYNVPLDTIFEEHPYWYYNSTIYFDDDNKSTQDINFCHELMSADYIMLNYCTAQLYDLGSKFLPKALVYLCYDQTEIDNKIAELKHNMKHTPEWFASLQSQADAQNKDIEEILHNNALYLVFMQPESVFNDLKGYKLPTDRNESLLNFSDPNSFEGKVERIIDDIYADTNWLNNIKKKAEQAGVDFETQMRNDAIWMLNNN